MTTDLPDPLPRGTLTAEAAHLRLALRLLADFVLAVLERVVRSRR